MDVKVDRKQKLKWRIRKKISGTPSRPRLAVFRSNKEIYAQLIDDTTGVTLVSANSRNKNTANEGNKTDKSKAVGMAIS
jgi:large subunit ribosomal protein L18